MLNRHWGDIPIKYKKMTIIMSLRQCYLLNIISPQHCNTTPTIVPRKKCHLVKSGYLPIWKSELLTVSFGTQLIIIIAAKVIQAPSSVVKLVLIFRNFTNLINIWITARKLRILIKISFLEIKLSFRQVHKRMFFNQGLSTTSINSKT